MFKSRLLILTVVIAAVAMLSIQFLEDDNDSKNLDQRPAVDTVQKKPVKEKSIQNNLPIAPAPDSEGELLLEDASEKFIDLEQAHATYIEMAEMGDVKSQAAIALVFRKCYAFPHFENAVERQQYFAQFDIDDGFTPERLRRYQAEASKLREKSCSLLRDSVSDFENQASRWERHALQGGSSVMKLEKKTLNKSPEQDEELFHVEAGLAGLKEAGSDLQLLEPVLKYITSHYNDFETHRYMEQTAWRILYCRVQDHCSDRLMNEYVYGTYHEHDAAYIYEMAESISVSIDNHNWEEVRTYLVTD